MQVRRACGHRSKPDAFDRRASYVGERRELEEKEAQTNQNNATNSMMLQAQWLGEEKLCGRIV